MNFQDKLDKAVFANNSLVCIGLDPDFTKSKKGQSQFEFNKTIIDQTASLVCAFKPQIAFYAAAGLKGLEDLKKTIEYIHEKYSQIPVILDAKRGDVGHTSLMYVQEVFDVFGADAVTVNPYCGFDSIEPFFKRSDRGVFVICRTSNPSAGDFQDLMVGNESLYVKVAKQIISWNGKYPNVFLEIGATWPSEVGVLRKLTENIPFLVAGIGAQGGDLQNTLKNGLRKDGTGLIISSSRGIIYAQNPKLAAQKLKDEVNKYR